MEWGDVSMNTKLRRVDNSEASRSHVAIGQKKYVQVFISLPSKAHCIIACQVTSITFVYTTALAIAAGRGIFVQ